MGVKIQEIRKKKREKEEGKEERSSKEVSYNLPANSAITGLISPQRLDPSVYEQLRAVVGRTGASRVQDGVASGPGADKLLVASCMTQLLFSHHTCHAYRLAPQGRQHKWVLTVSKGIWSVLTIWDITRQQKYFNGLRKVTENGPSAFRRQWDPTQLRVVETDLRSVNITGDVKALSDDIPKTVIYNWKTEERAHLDDVGDNQHDHCLQFVFTAPTILVIRTACSITPYTAPPTCIATRSFG
ncbi:hypothetical protein ARMSODRAFT_1065520 [Armillaria solidipes]|uniref:Uncharacterized protein n=1 Tax=Armillaria solidipes TaxID=1076256 RepID=A0A2H3B917_9AGAR|nr:hypothetical protein ARMSODRAFT_1065520 [Armillaria solidipes]